MIILIILSIITIAGYFLREHFAGFLMELIASALLILCLLTLAVTRIVFNSEKAKYNAFKETLKISRMDKSSLENAAITAKITDWNEWIAENKYYNSTIFDIWVPDEIEKLETIK